MTFNYQLNEDDFAAAQACHVRSYYKKPRARIFLAMAALMIFSGATVVIQSMLRKDTEALIRTAPFVVLGLLWIAWFARMLSSGSMFRKQFRKIRALQLPLQIVLTESGISYSSANGESRADWRAIERWQECKSNFMFYTQPRLFYILPKRIMQPEEIIATRELLASKVTQS